MEVRLLGPIEASVEGRPVALGTPQQRAVLAMLALHVNQVLSTDRLVEGLWGETAPPTAHKVVQLYVSRLRKLLDGPDAQILTRGRGYELRLAPEHVDVFRFERLLITAAQRNGSSGGAAREALALWRGGALADIVDEPFANTEVRRLEAMRVRAAELAIDADLEAGRHAEALHELDALIAQDPLSERLRAQRMLALYRSGRQGEALEAYREARTALVEALGVEPGPELRRLHEAILRQDPALDLAGPEPVNLPAGLDRTRPLVGRGDDLDRLQERRRRSKDGRPQLVLILGPDGMGKTRLAAELAAEVHRDGDDLFYAAGGGPRDIASAVLEAARAAQRPSVLVFDDVDRASAEVQAALGRLDAGHRRCPLLVIATAQQPPPVIRLRADETRELTPLDADGVSAVALHYAAISGDAEVPVQSLLTASAGVPRRVHRAAAAWARSEAMRRVGRVADRTAVERAGTRATEDELAGSLVRLQVVDELAAAADRDPLVEKCPFMGLSSFDLQDADLFFGRERLVAELVARAAGTPLLGVLGPSGSGKSSVLRAGLLAALAAGVLPGSEAWDRVVVRPGEHPLHALQQALAGVEGDRVVVAVDQFEEVFTSCRDAAERARFIDALGACTRDPRRPALVLIALRADFYGHCAAHPELARMLGANQVLVGTMRRDELRRSIELPARRAGLRVEPALVDALVADVDGEPGGLPLLSTALVEQWEQRDGQVLRLSAYEESGGVRGAVARLAERAYARLDGDDRQVARSILLRLAGEGHGGDVVRERVPVGELAGGRRERVAEVLCVLADERLVTIGEGHAEVAHEALLREWPRLCGWLEDDAVGRRLHRHLRAAAKDWETGGREASELYRGARLASTLDWAAGHAAELTASERAFLDGSRATSERAHRRLRMVLAGVAMLLVVVVIAGVVALDERGNARAEALSADAQRLGAQALVEDDVDTSLLLAVQGVALNDSVQTRGNLLATLLKRPAVIGVIHGGDNLLTLDLSPDERTVAFIEHDGTLTVADTRTRRSVRPPYTHPRQDSVAETILRLDHLRFSPDGSRLALGWERPVVLDARTHGVLARLPIGSDEKLYALRFSPDGRTLYGVVWLADGGAAIQRFEARTGRPRARRRIGSRPGYRKLLVTSDGRRLVTTSAEDRETVIRDARSLRALRRLPVGAEQVALTADDRTMLAGGRDGSVAFVDLVSGEATRASGRHDGAVVRAAFSADGRTAVTAGEDGRVIVWDVGDAVAAETLAGHDGRITGLAISRDGSSLYTAARDGKVLSWDLTGARRLGRPFGIGPGNDGETPRYALAPDGRILAAGHGDGTVTVLDGRTLALVRRFRVVRDGPVRGMGFVPRSGLLVVGGEAGFLALVDPGRGAIVRRLRGHRDRVYTPGISADGRLMATAGPDNTVRLWALPSGRPVGRPLRHPVVGDVSLSPDGRTLAVTRTPAGTAPTGIEIFDVPTLRRRASLSHDETVYELARFTPDGRFLVGGSWKGWARLWSTTTWKPASRPLPGHAGPVIWHSTSRDGRMLATGSTDGTVRLFDLRTGQPFAAALPALPNRHAFPQFTPDGKYLFAFTDVGRAYRWDVRPSSWVRHACAVAGRRLTRAEWEDVLPERPYAPACAD